MKEGRKIKSLPPMNVVGAYFMPNRNGASNHFSMKLDITETDKYLHEKRKDNMSGLGLMHVILSSYVRTISRYPGINRFIRGQKIYSRNEIELCLTIKKDMSLDAQETVVKLSAKPDATINDIYEGMRVLIEENRVEGDSNGMDFFARGLTFLPSILLKLCVSLIRGLDFFGLLPRAITRISPFHGSMFITNLGSLGIPPVYHHLYDFGNIPMFISMGKKDIEYYVTKEGSTEKRKTITINIVCDERICDGHYYATAFKSFKKYIEQAWLLEETPKELVKDIR